MNVVNLKRKFSPCVGGKNAREKRDQGLSWSSVSSAGFVGQGYRPLKQVGRAGKLEMTRYAPWAEVGSLRASDERLINILSRNKAGTGQHMP